jgi:fructose-1,6-bisphosphatase/inositol monophosphatase family enzyme
MKLIERIDQAGLWPKLEQTAIQTVTTGGMAAMGYYRDAWQQQLALDEEKKNPSTLADLQATSAIMQTCHTLLSPLTSDLQCDLSYLGEDDYDDFLRHAVGADVLEHKHATEVFFKDHHNVLRVIFDGIDGTNNFNLGIPLFCTAAAILVEDQVRVSAIYDPIHHHVFSAVLPGPYPQPELGSRASAWEVASGSRLDLVAEAQASPARPLRKEPLGIHLTRSDRQKLSQFLGSPRIEDASMLERLAAASGGIYALNSGIVAMKEVARGALGGFVNIVTNPWDVAAGEVLVRATGGTVTDFNGQPIAYDAPGKVSLVAAKRHLHAQILEIVRSDD